MNKLLLKNISTLKISEYEYDGKTMLQIYNNILELVDEKDLEKYLKNENIVEYYENIRKRISKIEDVLPLFDIFSKRMFMINKHNLYNRIVHENYRIINEQLLEKLKKNKNNMYENIISFVQKYYNVKILEKTYMIVFYKYSNDVGKEITICKRPSFLSIFKHIKPYYTRSEIINMGLNMKLIKSDNETYYNEKLLNDLCIKVRENDINAKILLEHRMYIINSKHINLIQYYSLNGSYFINKYLRNLNNSEYYNEMLHNNIEQLWNIVQQSPAFDKDYILYRFVNDDSYMSNLNIGDYFMDKGFMSATRDPFYNNDTYKFGFILIKLKIPKNIKGVGLSIESFSNFSHEQEIIITPCTVFKLVAKDMDCEYYTPDNEFNSQIIRKYEFEYVENKSDRSEILENIKNTYIDIKTDEVLDLDKITVNNNLSLTDRVKYFQNNYINEIFQFKININNKILTIQTEWYDSSLAYKGFYALENKDGFSMYCFYDNKMLFFFEIMEILHELHVNYYFRHSENVNLYDYISENDFIYLLSKISQILGIQKVIIYGNYQFCHKWKNNTTSTLGSFRTDFLNYFLNSTKRFENISEIQPRFEYFQLDRLKRLNPSEILHQNESDEMYQIWIQSKTKTIAELYLYVVNNYCNLIGILENKIKRVFKGMQSSFNPFLFDYYVLEPYIWLYKNKYISYLPTLDKQIVDIPLVVEEKNKNRYRL
jgi:hypothetical protein